MIKGIGKRIVLLNDTNSEIFEQAIFILRSNEKIGSEDVVKECERMMNLHTTGKKRIKGRDIWKVGFYLMLGASIILLILCIALVAI